MRTYFANRRTIIHIIMQWGGLLQVIFGTVRPPPPLSPKRKERRSQIIKKLQSNKNLHTPSFVKFSMLIQPLFCEILEVAVLHLHPVVQHDEAVEDGVEVAVVESQLAYHFLQILPQ